MSAAPLRVEVLSLSGCPGAAETLRLTREIAAAMAPGAEVVPVQLSEAEARERGLPGSPTVLVNGRDIEGRVSRAAGAA